MFYSTVYMNRLFPSKLNLYKTKYEGGAINMRGEDTREFWKKAVTEGARKRKSGPQHSLV